MNVIYYKRRFGKFECERIKISQPTSETEIRFDVEIEGSVLLGKTLKKIEGKSCIFDTGRLEDGFYRPSIHLKASVIEPEGFEISGGIPKLVPKDDAYIRELSRRIDALFSECSEIKEKLSEHEGKINGNPLF